MKKMNILLLFASMLFFGSTCNKEIGDCHKHINIINNSDNAIYVMGDTHYPDTSYFGYFSSPISDSFSNKITSNSESNRPLQNRDCWETVFNYGVQIPSDTLMIFIFDEKVLKSVKWETIVKDYMVLKRYDLSLQDLESMNWTITYP